MQKEGFHILCARFQGFFLVLKRKTHYSQNFISMHILLLILALFIIIIVMIQSKGTGLSIVPGSGDFGKFERRGPEKILHNLTIGVIVIFILGCMVSYFIS